MQLELQKLLEQLTNQLEMGQEQEELAALAMSNAYFVSSYASGPRSEQVTRFKSTKKERAKIDKRSEQWKKFTMGWKGPEVLEHEHPLELIDLQPPKNVDVWEEESDDDGDDLIIEDEFRCPCNRCHQDITVYHRVGANVKPPITHTFSSPRLLPIWELGMRLLSKSTQD
ncbi:hypothetical protein Tco_1531860 [Tanacetum coccineum]